MTQFPITLAPAFHPLDSRRAASLPTPIPTWTWAEWRSLVDMVPAAFGSFSPWVLAKQGLGLIQNASNEKRYGVLRTELQARLRAARVPVLIEQGSVQAELVAPSELKRNQRRWLGQIILELYFTQLLRCDSAAIDLWPSRLGMNADGDAVWSPRPLYLRWDRRFVKAIRDFYAGFFLDDQERFDTASRALGLGAASELLRAHMGGGNQRSVRFSASALRDTLDALPALRGPRDRSMHGNFIAFGLYLSSLHANLESLDLPFDVRAAFARSHAGLTKAKGAVS